MVTRFVLWTVLAFAMLIGLKLDVTLWLASMLSAFVIAELVHWRSFR